MRFSGNNEKLEGGIKRLVVHKRKGRRKQKSQGSGILGGKISSTLERVGSYILRKEREKSPQKAAPCSRDH